MALAVQALISLIWGRAVRIHPAIFSRRGSSPALDCRRCRRRQLRSAVSVACGQFTFDMLRRLDMAALATVARAIVGILIVIVSAQMSRPLRVARTLVDVDDR